MTIPEDVSGGVLDKITLNNEIVALRQHVRCSRVHTINKLVRTVRSLKTKKGTDEQKQKHLRKADNLLGEIKIIKTLSDDEVSKFSLKNSKSPLAILNKTGEPKKRKVLARLSMHHSMVSRIAKFHLQFPDWKQSVPRLLQMIGSGHKSSGKQKEKGGQKQCSLKRADLSVFKLADEKKPYQLTTSVDDTKKVKCFLENEHKTKMAAAKCESIEKTKKPKSKGIQVEKKCNMTEKLVQMENAVLSKEVDPFFITKDDKEFMTTIVSHSENVLRDGVGFKGRTSFKQEMNEDIKTTRKKCINPFESKNGGRGNMFGGMRYGPDKAQKRKDYTQKPVSKRKGNYAEVLAMDTKLHPSWEAKKKQSSIVVFQGKKKSFDD